MILSTRDVITRKEHDCAGCARTFPSYTKLNVIVWVDMGKAHNHYWCSTCQEYWRLYMESDDEIGVGDLRFEDPETWEKVRKKVEES
jgi:hypothetical protein